jgi:hypothetical protein
MGLLESGNKDSGPSHRLRDPCIDLTVRSRQHKITIQALASTSGIYLSIQRLMKEWDILRR